MKRLVKVAKELNVGLSTIVDHLTGKGFEIESKPTAKVTDEMYEELLNEFKGSLEIKKSADQIVIGTRPSSSKKEESAPAPKVEPKATVAKVEKAPPPPPPVPKTPEVKESVVKEVKEAPKVEKVKEEVKEPVMAKVEAVKEALKVEEKPKTEAPQEAKEETSKVGLKVLGKIDLEAQKKKATPKAKKAASAKDKSQPKQKTKETSKPKVEKNTPPAPSKKVAKEKPVEKEQKPSTASTPTTAPTEDKPDTKATPTTVEHVQRKTPELRGLKVLGKIDTDKFKKPKKEKKSKKDNTKPQQKKPNASGTNANDKKKTEGASDTNKPKRRRRRTTTTVPSRNNNNNNNRGRNNRQGNRPTSRKDEVKEISQKEIDEKIKATMAKIKGGGKKKRQKLRRENRDRHREKEETKEMEAQAEKLQVTEFISVSELASLMNVEPVEVITTCFSLGVIVSINQRLEADIIELVASEFGHEIEFISAEEQVDDEIEQEEDNPEDLTPRAPIVTVMGHVDHGKTSLLDYIRSAKVAEGEAGGITQHIGAYEVKVGEENKRITFLDTPGHEAFTAMRARGAKVTDIAIIIIAADDSIMPQTKEAISHSQAADVPMVFAINKIDKPGAQPERIKQELANMNLLIEEWGGEYQSMDISAKTGQNIDELLEKVILEAEMLELKANPKRMATGTVLEASLDKGRGYVANLLVQNGTLNVGDPVVAGEHSGKIKAMFNERGQRLKEAGPSKPVLVLGLSGAPAAGERFKEMETEPEARQIATKRAQIAREQSTRASKRVSLEEIGRRIALGSFKELNLIVKGDVDGSIQALSDSLIKLSIESVQVNVIHQAVGQIIESDVMLASASDAIIIGFQVRPSLGARKLAEKEGVEIKTYSVIYEAIEEVKLAIEGMLEPTKEEKIKANVEVRDVFKISRVGTIAGCIVQDGLISRNSKIRLIRNGIVIFPTKEGAVGELASLKRFKDDVKEVKAGMECGVGIKNYNDIKVGDVIEAYEIVEVKTMLK